MPFVYTVVGGEVYYRENSRMVKPELNATAAERVKGMVALRDCVNELIALQMDEYSAESRIQEVQAELNRLYDAFSAKHGLINDRANRLAFSDDSSYYLLCSLEVLDDDGKLERKRTGTGAILPTTGLGPTPCSSPPILTHGVLTATAIWPSAAIPVWSICFSARPAKPTHRNGRKPLSGIS